LKKLTIYLFLALISIFSINSCSSSKQAAQENRNQAYLYAKQSAVPTVRTKVFHLSADSSDVYIGIDNKYLQYDTASVAHITTIIKLFEQEEDGRKLRLKDSSINVFNLKRMPKSSTATLGQKVAIPDGKDYVIQLNILDRLAKRAFRKTIDVFKSDPYNAQNFVLTELGNSNKIIFKNYMTIGTAIKVRYRDDRIPLTLKHYAPSKKLATPPFIIRQDNEKFTATNATSIENGQFTLEHRGMYFIKVTNETAKTGINLMAVEKKYPRLTQAEDLVEVLRYITKTEEYKRMLNSDRPKAQVDEFWLKRAGSRDRGRILIKEFYGRVQRSNEFFTTYKEGWKTDRGLIYIIYGVPQSVIKKNTYERWVYQSPNSQQQLQFTFHRQAIPFTTERFLLRRDRYFEDSWHRAVFEWRKGIISNRS